MKRKNIPQNLRNFIVLRAKNRCEYCQTQSEQTAMPMEVDHITPVKLEGLNNEENLCLACSYCNGSKKEAIKGIDRISGEEANIFNPRTQKWEEHFQWSNSGEEIVGITSTGRVTVHKLKLNRAELVIAREIWVKYGWHPPKD